MNILDDAKLYIGVHSVVSDLQEDQFTLVRPGLVGAESALQSQMPRVGRPAEVPESLCCPISYNIFRDPVLLVETGQTYVGFPTS